MVLDREATQLQEQGQTIISWVAVADLVETLQAIGVDPAKAKILSAYIKVDE